jgi:hypothetical protein
MLTVKILNPEKQFNVKTDTYLSCSEKVFMEYSLFVEHLLCKNKVGYQVRDFFKFDTPRKKL